MPSVTCNFRREATRGCRLRVKGEHTRRSATTCIDFASIDRHDCGHETRVSAPDVDAEGVIVKTPSTKARRRARLAVILAGLLVGVLGFAAPASANTGLGGGVRVVSCPAAPPGDPYCYMYSDLYGNFAIIAWDASCGALSTPKYCLVGYGYFRKLDNYSSPDWAWRIYDNQCDGHGVYLNTRTPANGCSNPGYIGAEVDRTYESSFHVDFGGSSPGGITYNVPDNLHVENSFAWYSPWDCPIPANEPHGVGCP